LPGSQQDIENFKAEVEKRQLKELSPSLSEGGKERNGGVIVTEVEDEPVSSPTSSVITNNSTPPTVCPTSS
jgi:hypothetical protein